MTFMALPLVEVGEAIRRLDVINTSTIAPIALQIILSNTFVSVDFSRSIVAIPMMNMSIFISQIASNVMDKTEYT